MHRLCFFAYVHMWFSSRASLLRQGIVQRDGELVGA